MQAPGPAGGVRLRVAASVLAGAILLVLLVAVHAGSLGSSKPPVAEEGILSLSNWSLPDNGPVRLDGTWKLYWARLLPPTDLAAVDAAGDFDFLRVPGDWRQQPYRGAALPRHGVATIVLTVDGVKPGRPLALKVGRILSAHNLWVDGVLLKSVGNVRPSPGELGDRWEAYVATFVPKAKEVQIVIEIANLTLRTAGVFESIELGEADVIQRAAQLGLVANAVLIGCLVGLSIYQFSLFAFRRKDVSPLLLALCCLFLALYSSVNGRLVFLLVFPDINWELFMKLFYTSYILTLCLLLAFLRFIFPKEISKRLAGGVISVATLAFLLVWILPHKWNTYVAPLYQLFAGVMLLYLLWAVFKAARDGREAGCWILIGMIVAVGCGVNDTLYSNRLVQTSPAITPYAWIVLLFCTSLVAASRFSLTFAKAEELSRELQINNALLEQRVAERTKELELVAVTDQLTQLFNRRKLDEVLAYEVERARRYGGSLSIILGDVDKFKSVNDTWGHQAGDQVLIAFAAILRSGVRSTDYAGRWGGEEFLVVCPNTSLENARLLAEQLRKLVESHDFPTVGNKTCSFGLASFDEDGSPKELIARADAALYIAKENGRNRVES